MNLGPEVQAIDDELSLCMQFLVAPALESLSRTEKSAIAARGGYWDAS
jgi:hypothetical protein